MATNSLPVMGNLESEELSLSSADLNTIIQVPTMDPFDIIEESGLQNISSLDVSQIQTDLLENLDQMELHLECDDDGNYDMPNSHEHASILPTALVGNNVSLRISFSSNVNIKQETDAKQSFVCPICGESFKIETKFQRHMISHHNISNPFKCEFCAYAASCRKLLVKHVKRRHVKSESAESSSTQYSHTKDAMEISCKSNEINQANISNEKVILNKVIDKNSARSYQEKDVGIISNHENSYLKCEKCEYTCKQKRSLDLHAKRHLNEFNFCCNICDKTYLSSIALKRHSKTHLEIRQFTCRFENCGKSFKINSALTDHERYVHGRFKKSQNKIDSETQDNKPNSRKRDKKFKCTYEGCEKYFRDSYNLRTHMARHSGVKGQKCSNCDFTCIQKTSMDWHLKSKHATH